MWFFIKMAIFEHFGEDVHGRDGQDHASKSKETLSSIIKKCKKNLKNLKIAKETPFIITLKKNSFLKKESTFLFKIIGNF